MTHDQQDAPQEAADHGDHHGPMPRFLFLVYAVIVISFLIYLVRFFVMQNTHPLYNF